MRLYAGVPGTSWATAYTAATELRELTVVFANTTGSDATVSVKIVPKVAMPASEFVVVPEVNVAGHSTAILEYPIAVYTGDAVSVKQGTSSACSVIIEGAPS